MRFINRGGSNPSSEDKFAKFTGRARKVMSLAQEEAQRFNHNYIGTEHLLLGLIREGDGVAAKVLHNLGVELTTVRREVEAIIGRGDRIVLGEIGMTPRSKKVLELAVDEARHMGHRYIGTEHLLLGLMREGEGIAAGVLASLGLGLEDVRAETLRVLGMVGVQEHEVPPATMPQPGGPKSNVVTSRLDDHALDALDALVEAGIRTTRSDAASWLIAVGIEAQRPLFERVYATVNEIRRLRTEAQAMAQEMAASAGNATTTPPQESSPDEPLTDEPPPAADTPPAE